MDLPVSRDSFVPAVDPALAPPFNIETATFEQLVTAVDRVGGNPGNPAAIGLYRSWIAINAGGTRLLYGAWFNLGVELSHAGATAEVHPGLSHRPGAEAGFLRRRGQSGPAT